MTFVDSFTRARESVAGHSVVADPPTHPYLQSLAQAFSEIVALGEPVTVSPVGTLNRIAKFTGVATVGDSIVSESGNVITVTGTAEAQLVLQASGSNHVRLIGTPTGAGVFIINAGLNNLLFQVAAVNKMTLDASALAPTSIGGLTSGTAALPWGNTFTSGYFSTTGGNVASDATATYLTAAQLRFKQAVGSEANAGVIDYATFDASALSIVGKGTTGGNRLVRIYEFLGIGAAASTSFSLVLNAGAQMTQLNLTAAVSKVVPGATSLSLRNTADSADNMLITDAGAVTFRSTVGGITTLTATTLAGTLSTAAQPNVTSLGTLTALTISGTLTFTAATSKIVPGATSISLRNTADSADNMLITDAGAVTFRSTVGGITTLTATTLAGTLSTAAQPNITSVGTLTSLTISGALTFTAAASKIVPGATSLSHRNNADSADNLLIKNAGVLGLRVLSADTTAAEGDFEFVGGTLHTVGFFDDEGVRWISKTLWVDANKTRTSTVDGSVTSKTIKANRLNVVGRALRIRVGGVNGVNSGNVNIKLGTQTLETLSMNANDPFWFEVTLACSATGATGTLQQSGLTIRGGTGAFSPDSSSFTLDLTVDQLLDVRGFVNTSGTLTVRVVEVELLATA